MEMLAGLELPDSRWVDVGGPVHYREWAGPSDGPAFVCVHGLGGSLLNWALVAPRLAEGGRVLALDLAGFGLTPLETRRSHVGANWSLLDGFLRALDLPPVILVGNSMGGKISLIQAAHAPATIDRLILVDAAFPRARRARAQPSPRVAAAFALYSSRRLGEWVMSNRTRRLGPERLVRETLRICTPNPEAVDPRLVAAMIEQTRKRQEFDYVSEAFVDAARSIFRAQAAPSRYRELVRRVRTPALVLHGARDPLVPLATAQEAAAEHSNWDLQVFDDLGHIPMMEAPGRWLDAVGAWLDRKGGGAETTPAPAPARSKGVRPEAS
jgi:pimeloyl-ACP methyl ester carboxylesterase